MEQTRQKLEILINIINISFPVSNDLKGFLGISKELVVNILTECDGLLISLSEQDNHFETIIMKRELAELFEKINRELDDNFDKIRPDKFDSFLKNVARIKFLIKETYTSILDYVPIR